MIIDDFDKNSKPVVDINAFYGDPKHLIDVCLITFSREINDYLLLHYECKKISEISSAYGPVPIYKFNIGDKEVGFYLSFSSSPNATSLCYEASHITGAKKFIMFGSCGSLNKDVTNGKYIVPIETYRGDGCSYYYKEASDYLNIKNADKVSKIFDELKVPYVKGRVWTTDSMLRETYDLVSKRRKEGCLAVEMELAGVEAACEYYGLELYNFLEPGDVLLEDGYEIKGLKEANHNINKALIAIEIARRI